MCNVRPKTILNVLEIRHFVPLKEMHVFHAQKTVTVRRESIASAVMEPVPLSAGQTGIVNGAPIRIATKASAPHHHHLDR